MDQDALKRSAALKALELIEPKLTRDAVIGIGTGSTANFFIEALGAHKHKFDACVASSQASTDRLQALGITVLDTNAAPAIAVYVDGADEINPAGQMIKGGGAALTREKIVAASSDAFVCIVDASKEVPVLGAYPLPVEVIPMARGLVARNIAALGGEPQWRQGVVTDNGNHIIDVAGLRIEDPAGLEHYLNNLVGVVCNGIFADQAADIVVSASSTGVEVRGA